MRTSHSLPSPLEREGGEIEQPGRSWRCKKEGRKEGRELGREAWEVIFNQACCQLGMREISWEEKKEGRRGLERGDRVNIWGRYGRREKKRLGAHESTKPFGEKLQSTALIPLT